MRVGTIANSMEPHTESSPTPQRSSVWSGRHLWTTKRLSSPRVLDALPSLRTSFRFAAVGHLRALVLISRSRRTLASFILYRHQSLLPASRLLFVPARLARCCPHSRPPPVPFADSPTLLRSDPRVSVLEGQIGRAHAVVAVSPIATARLASTFASLCASDC